MRVKTSHHTSFFIFYLGYPFLFFIWDIDLDVSLGVLIGKMLWVEMRLGIPIWVGFYDDCGGRPAFGYGMLDDNRYGISCSRMCVMRVASCIFH
jgi:hypothetical protein